ncbi:carotenoid oxygenase family protein [Salinibacter ruber]|uniref:carotenoid oxygenase family protein n=1 Tax=Salinibacter ruber TaxID=146919 RepID=UPI0013C37A7F|nr:carotenoid oxygenase family protein [Salinibacter ruber]MCS3640658.1 carotenoid cleavage dioxygenase-like enzyme [Salinibacter ruber]MCS4175187.1 carotenoid cleavage dioxygenase-like enzyme [Salinibacter ruber]
MSDYRRGFESLCQELHEPSLPVEGEWPDWLEGTLIRNGPAQFEVGDEDYNHWFDGHAMLHAFRMRDGTVSYRNRFVRSQSRTEALEQGRIARSEFATDPCMSLFGRVMSVFNPNPTDNASINVARLDDQYVALTATPLPVAFDPETLETAGVVEYDDDVDVDMSTPHPQVEPGTGRMLFHTLSFGRQCQYGVYGTEAEGKTRRPVATLDVDRPSYMHSFGMSERYVILSEWPLVVNPTDLLLRGRPFIENFEWQPERGTRFRVLRKADGAEVATCEAEAAFGFHHVNAFERDGAVVCDVVTYPDASVVEELSLDRLRSDAPSRGSGHLRRYRLPLDGGAAASTLRGEERIELPRIHDGPATGRPYQYVYGVGTRAAGQFTDQLVKTDVPAGTAQTWHEEGTYPGEPVFVAAPDGAREDEGVVLSVVLDPDAQQSFLLVLDAPSFTERARAAVPHPIPFGFHGQFFD